jgi:hypothetical protein
VIEGCQARWKKTVRGPHHKTLGRELARSTNRYVSVRTNDVPAAKTCGLMTTHVLFCNRAVGAKAAPAAPKKKSESCAEFSSLSDTYTASCTSFEPNCARTVAAHAFKRLMQSSLMNSHAKMVLLLRCRALALWDCAAMRINAQQKKHTNTTGA